MTNDEKKKLYAALSAPFPPESIERTRGSETGKAYDTAGVRAQWLLNRLNETLGVGGYRIHRTIDVRPITTAKGRSMHEAICDMTVELGEYVDGHFVVFAESVSDGGHTAVSAIDAKKGAHTGALKRALAGFGIGKASWEGTLDDDNVPGEHAPAPVAPVITVVRAPAAQPVVSAPLTPPGYQNTNRQMPERNRLSSKQLACLMSINRKMGIDVAVFRAKVKEMHGVQVEFLTRDQASALITALQARLNSNGSGHHLDEQVAHS